MAKRLNCLRQFSSQACVLPSDSERAMQKRPFSVGASEDMATPVAPGLAFALGIEQKIKGDISLHSLIPKGVERLKPMVLLQPAVGRRDQEVIVRFGSSLAASP